MRIPLVGCVLLAAIQPSFAQKLLTKEPLILDPYAVVYVNDGSCSVGKILKVTGYSRLTPQKVLRTREGSIQVIRTEVQGVKMNSAAKRTASQSLARMLTVTAMPAIAGFMFYSR